VSAAAELTEDVSLILMSTLISSLLGVEAIEVFVAKSSSSSRVQQVQQSSPTFLGY
jgi:hypothetical protein